MRLKLKKVISMSLILGSLLTTTAFAYSEMPIHSYYKNSWCGYTAGYSWTDWTARHYTKSAVGNDVSTVYGRNYTQTDVVSGFGWFKHGCSDY